MARIEANPQKPIPRKVRQKLERWAILCYDNCVRLHEDSVILYKRRRYPSAHALSVIALEERGKYEMLAHGLFYNFFDNEDSAKLILDDVYNHKMKQRIFMHMDEDPSGLYVRDMKRLNKTAEQELQEIYKKYGYSSKESLKYFPSLARLEKRFDALESEKQDSLYVGFPKKGKNIDFSRRIHSPFNVSRRRAERQITLLSDYLVLEAVGVLKGFRSMDFWELEDEMTHDYIDYLRLLWPIMTRAHRRMFNKWMRLADREED